jgi:mRNA interferase HigB
MRVIAKSTLVEYGRSHTDALGPLIEWYSNMRRCTARNMSELRQTFSSADPVGDRNEFVCFNIKGNNYRLITAVHFGSQITFIHEVLTHAGYTGKYVKRRNR